MKVKESEKASLKLNRSGDNDNYKYFDIPPIQM